MWYTVKKNKHRFSPLQIGLFPRLERDVRFDFSCRYNVGKDQTDTNKLFGVGYFPGHHRHSARFGWEYDPVSDKILVSAYVYSLGERIDRPMALIPMGKQVRMTITPYEDGYAFLIYDGVFTYHETVLCVRPAIKIGYRLGAYFGGTSAATHEMKIEIV